MYLFRDGSPSLRIRGKQITHELRREIHGLYNCALDSRFQRVDTGSYWDKKKLKRNKQNLHERMIDREFREWNPKNARSMDGRANRDRNLFDQTMNSKHIMDKEHLNVHQRPLGQICPAGGSVPQGQQSSAGSVGSAPSPASPRPTPQPRPPVASTASQPSRTLDDDRSTDAVGTGTAAEDSDDGESIAQYVSTNCVVFTHYRGDAASEVEEHFQRALAHDKPKENISPMFMRNFPPSFWKSQHPGEVYECPTDPWHPHYPQYHHRAVHEYHHHNMATVTSYGGLLLGGARGLGHHAAHHAHSAASYKDWPSATPSQSFVDASSAPSYPHGYYAPLSAKIKRLFEISKIHSECIRVWNFDNFDIERK
ncbi:Protein vestigial [Apis cerana cerana]|uniref:Protein vestigial n=1 Tax=Apis cerana cerana TaxID=94128 RepID=A0A2A3EN01_APICC|nr:Protein vestigial [Apis cerana cerana]